MKSTSHRERRGSCHGLLACTWRDISAIYRVVSVADEGNATSYPWRAGAALEEFRRTAAGKTRYGGRTRPYGTASPG